MSPHHCRGTTAPSAANGHTFALGHLAAGGTVGPFAAAHADCTDNRHLACLRRRLWLAVALEYKCGRRAGGRGEERHAIQASREASIPSDAQYPSRVGRHTPDPSWQARPRVGGRPSRHRPNQRPRSSRRCTGPRLSCFTPNAAEVADRGERTRSGATSVSLPESWMMGMRGQESEGLRPWRR